MVKQHAACSISPSQVNVWVSELLFKSDSNYPESNPSMLFISIPLFVCQSTISVLASLRMCYEMISYLAQRTRHHKKKIKKTHPHNRCVTPALLAKFSKMTSFALFGSYKDFFFLLFDGVYMYARVWRCNRSPVFVDCRQVSRGKDNNRWSRNLFMHFTDEIAY